MASRVSALDEVQAPCQSGSPAVGPVITDCPDSLSIDTLIIDLAGSSGSMIAEEATRRRQRVCLVTDVPPEPEAGIRHLRTEAFFSTATAIRGANQVILIPPRRRDQCSENLVDRCLWFAAKNRKCVVCVLSSFRVHLRDSSSLKMEEWLKLRLVNSVPDRWIMVRTGHLRLHATGRAVASDRWSWNAVSPTTSDKWRRQWWKTVAAFHPIVPLSVRSCFLDLSRLLPAIDQLSQDCRTRTSRRTYTLLGENRALRDVLADSSAFETLSPATVAVVGILRILMVGILVDCIFRIASRLSRRARSWRLETLEPRSFEELLSLYHRSNLRYVAVAGYNNGVSHFGWRYPGKTVIKTIASGSRVRCRGSHVDVDAGATLRRLIEELDRERKELYVVPNYSYISAGTAYFVPIHGSGSAVSTLGETIDKVVAFDADKDDFVVARKGDAFFNRHMYDPGSDVLLLRLRYRVRPRTYYRKEQAHLDSQSADDVWSIFTDSQASNVEIRKNRAGGDSIQVSRYYRVEHNEEGSLDVPKDRVGRIWDRIEENRLTSTLFHKLVRTFGYHVELFLNKEEFRNFWEAHQRLPVSKLQLRMVYRDGIPHSPAADQDRISIDMFMRRSSSEAFLRFVRQRLPHAKFNPGKHSL